MNQVNGIAAVENTQTYSPARSTRLAKAMESINLADSAEEQVYYRNLASELGLRLKPGFYVQKRKISQALINQVQATTDDNELIEILKEANYRELVF